MAFPFAKRKEGVFGVVIFVVDRSFSQVCFPVVFCYNPILLGWDWKPKDPIRSVRETWILRGLYFVCWYSHEEASCSLMYAYVVPGLTIQY